MIIVHQSRMGITNFDSCKSIQLNGRGIEAFYLDGTKKTIAFYEKEGRSAEVFTDILKGIGSGLIVTLYLPEE